MDDTDERDFKLNTTIPMMKKKHQYRISFEIVVWGAKWVLSFGVIAAEAFFGRACRWSFRVVVEVFKRRRYLKTQGLVFLELKLRACRWSFRVIEVFSGLVGGASESSKSSSAALLFENAG
ncbi:hypothetical protein C2G38_2196549 [Gigaspora rosea]|uniref:Transmembrane protein n=1 Tax=Gigaspora rosea TaxID=44941 RepID=A0A397UXL4_9GLOM|nr:hypothetical protein C2G38_2196549 [Gigaspora rosea]